MSFTQYFALIAALGIPIYGVRVISQAVHDKKLLYAGLSQLLSIHVICSILFTALYVVSIFAFPFFKAERSLYILAGLNILMGFTSIDWYFSGVENFRLIAIRSVTVKAISLVFLYLFVKTKADYSIYLFISIFSLLGNNIINILSVSRSIKLGLSGLKQHLKPLMYTFGTTVATSMYTMLDSILIGFFSDEKAVGLYTASIKLTKISIPFIISSATVLMPRISKLFASSDSEGLDIILNKSFSFIAVLAVPVCIALLFLAPQLIYIFSGVQFTEAILTMQLLSPLGLIIGLGYFWGFQILIPAGKEREMMIAVMIGMIVNLSLNCFLIPVYRQNGAAFANIISELIVTLGYMFYAYRAISFKISHRPLVLNIIATIPFIGVVFLCHLLKLNVYYTIALSSISALCFYFGIQIKIFKNSVVLEYYNEYLLKRKANV